MGILILCLLVNTAGAARAGCRNLAHGFREGSMSAFRILLCRSGAGI